MSVHVLLNLLNDLNSDKMRGYVVLLNLSTRSNLWSSSFVFVLAFYTLHSILEGLSYFPQKQIRQYFSVNLPKKFRSLRICTAAIV